MSSEIIKQQLVRDIDRTKDKHDKIKEEINVLLDELLEIETKVNKKIEELNDTEKKYVELVEMYSK